MMIAGVLSGAADYFGQDKALFRLLSVFFLIVTGIMPGVLFYIIAWIVMPLPSVANSTPHATYTVHKEDK